MAGVSKSFAGNRVLREVGFDVRPGEIHALVGGNGSGKSTLIKILAGVYTADEGSLTIRGETHDLRHASTAMAHDAGLRFVHQVRSTFPDLTVAENLAIGYGFDIAAGYRIKGKALERRARSLLDQYGLDVSPRAELRTLRPSAQTMVAIARALQQGDSNGMLVLDEATATLPPADVDLLMGALRRYADAGLPILFVSHRLDEVLDAADRVTALRDGACVGTRPRADLDRQSLADFVVGQPVHRYFPPHEGSAQQRVLLRATGVHGGIVQGVTVDVHAGEVVGLVGLAGSGCSTLLRLMFGAQKLEQGTVELDGKEVRIRTPRDAIRAGVALVPSDRETHAAFGGLTVLENMALASTEDAWSGGRLRLKAERARTKEEMKRYTVKAQSPTTPIKELSGGNQQKVIFARWLRRRPRVILLDEPTQGVDIGARTELWSLIRESVEGGAGVLVASSDIDELVENCDRILLVHEGRIAQELSSRPFVAETVIRAMHTVNADAGR